MKITLSNSILDSIDSSNPDISNNIPSEYRPYFWLKSGREHYRLLLFLSDCYKNSIISDIGTNRGASALALSANKTNKIYSVDIIDVKKNEPIKRPENCEFIISNILEDESTFNKILESKMIFLDIDHLYTNEIKIYKKLIDSKWRGLIFCDDIHLNSEMKKFWQEVAHTKIDITKYGHGSGTGVIVMDDSELELL